jgi:transposase
MTTLSSTQAIVLSELRADSNSADNFLDWILWLVAERHLVRGDFLVFDNGSVHTSYAITPMLSTISDVTGIRFITLPTYSPELNPCELVFAQVKRELTTHRNANTSFAAEILRAFARVSFANVIRYYMRCLWCEFDLE